MFYEFELGSVAKVSKFFEFISISKCDKSRFWPKMTISGVHSQLDWTIPKNGQFDLLYKVFFTKINRFYGIKLGSSAKGWWFFAFLINFYKWKSGF